ncbi:hypothetical protein QYF36_012061 [Acer negundo]|nr:hypothetical protein QYF36_012061 [Acer negundo]
MQTAENERATTENERPTTSLSGGATAENEGATTSLSGGATTSNELNAAVDRREQVAGQMENINYEQFLKVKRNKWNEEALINVGCWLKNLATTENIIRKERKHKEFMSSCFKQFSNFLQNSLFSAMIVHGVLLREITIDGATENELFISLGVEMKDKNELLDTWDDGDDGGHGGEVGEGGDKDDVGDRGFTPGYTPTLPPRSSFMQPPPHMLSRQEPRSRDGDRMNELLEAIKALLDLLESIVKWEVSQLLGVLKGLMQEIQSTHGQNSNEEVDANMSTEQEMGPSCQKEVDDEGLHIDAYMSLLAKRMESDREEYKHSFVLLSSEFYTKVKVEWNRIIEANNEAGSSLDALAYECPADWIAYGLGNRLGWG